MSDGYHGDGDGGHHADDGDDGDHGDDGIQDQSLKSLLD